MTRQRGVQYDYLGHPQRLSTRAPRPASRPCTPGGLPRARLDRPATAGRTRGTDVLLSPFVVHRDPPIWENAGAFDPQPFGPGRGERIRLRRAQASHMQLE
jgi:hypothetical protein